MLTFTMQITCEIGYIHLPGCATKMLQHAEKFWENQCSAALCLLRLLSDHRQAEGSAGFYDKKEY